MDYLGGTMQRDHPLLEHVYTPELDHLATLFARGGHELRIVGGAVRDILSGETPQDIDMASTARPEQVVALLESAGVKVVETGLQHGTVMAMVNKISFEITTLRIDEVTDGRHAKVKFTTDWHLDALRRDLTINAMSVSLGTGHIYDYFGGKGDLEKKIVRFVGEPEERITEDYLRILRYFRFFARICGTNTHTENIEHVFRKTAKGLEGISGERVWKELRQLIAIDHSPVAIESMMKCEVGKTILLPEYCSVGLLERVMEYTRDPVVLVVTLFEQLDDFELAAKRWKLSRMEYEMGRFVIKNRGKMGLHDGKLMLADTKKQTRDFMREKIVQTLLYDGLRNEAEEFATWQVPEFPVSGKDLQTIGIASGKEMGSLILSLREEWKKCAFQMTKDELMAAAKEAVAALSER